MDLSQPLANASNRDLHFALNYYTALRRIELESVSCVYKTPRVLDRPITLNDYDGALRQLIITDLGHENPTHVTE
jgi:hypothetical protein